MNLFRIFFFSMTIAFSFFPKLVSNGINNTETKIFKTETVYGAVF
nr:MAG TPA: hypothetical protein [Caudoviricetes sp.]